MFDRNKYYRDKRHPNIVKRLQEQKNILNNISEVTWAYIAGLIDGEGCIHIAKGKPQKRRINLQYTLKISVGMTNENVINWLHKILGGENSKRNNGEYKTIYRWSCSSVKAYKILTMIYPYLQVKKIEAEIGMEFKAHVEEYYLYNRKHRVSDSEMIIRKSFYNKMKELKHG